MPVSQYASTRAIRELGGFATIIALILMFAVGKAVLYDTMDPDFFWHLRVAEQLHREGVGPIVDQLSFASVKTPWTPYSWLGELAMKWVWDHAGLRGAVVTQAALEAMFIALVLMCALQIRAPSPGTPGEGRGEGSREECGSPAPDLSTKPSPFPLPEYRERVETLHDTPIFALMPLVITTALCCFLALPYLSFRPVLAAVDLLAVCALLLLRDRRLPAQSKLIWLVPVIVALTINLHIFAIFVPMWVGALMVGAWIERDRTRARRYAILLLLCALACCCTPMLGGTLATIRYYATTDPLTSHSMIAEFEPMYRGALHQATMGVVALLIIAAIAQRRVRAGEMLWVGGMFVLWIRCGRAAPIFVPIFAPIVMRALPRLSDGALAGRWVSLAGACVLFVGAIRISLSLPDNSNMDAWLNRHGPDLPGYPTAAADYVATTVHRSSGCLINEFDWGGYLAWRLPEFKVFLDGRTQLYTPQFWEAAYLEGPGETKRLLSSVEADAAILPAGKSRFRESLTSLGWKRVFHDERAEVFVPPSSIARTEN